WDTQPLGYPFDLRCCFPTLGLSQPLIVVMSSLLHFLALLLVRGVCALPLLVTTFCSFLGPAAASRIRACSLCSMGSNQYLPGAYQIPPISFSASLIG